MAANGFTIQSEIHGEHHVKPWKVLRTPAEAGQTYDYVVCAHKAIDQDTVPKQLSPAVEDGKTTIVIIQNGVGNEAPFRSAFPKSTILTAVTWVGAIQNTPGIVQHLRVEDTQIGLFPNEAGDQALEDERLSTFTSLLNKGGTPFNVLPNMQIRRWEKVVYNVVSQNPSVFLLLLSI